MDDRDRLDKWRHACDKAKQFAKQNGITASVADCVWLVPRNEGLSFIGDCIGYAKLNGIKFETKFLDEEN